MALARAKEPLVLDSVTEGNDERNSLSLFTVQEMKLIEINMTFRILRNRAKLLLFIVFFVVQRAEGVGIDLF